ncbi:MAG: hypothetical protein H6823_23960 [Planctomycetaceae bacterium]|nr:hypothetical protein [Planctomycetaceae bacterium]
MQQERDAIEQQQAALDKRDSHLEFAMIAHIRGVSVDDVNDRDAYRHAQELHNAIQRRRAIHEDELLASDEIGQRILTLREEKDNLLDVVWLATSPKQIKELWTKVAGCSTTAKRNTTRCVGNRSVDDWKQVRGTERSVAKSDRERSFVCCLLLVVLQAGKCEGSRKELQRWSPTWQPASPTLNRMPDYRHRRNRPNKRSCPPVPALTIGGIMIRKQHDLGRVWRAKFREVVTPIPERNGISCGPLAAMQFRNIERGKYSPTVESEKR